MRQEGNPLMDISTLGCDVCGEQKSGKGQWFIAITSPGWKAITFYPAEMLEREQWMAVKYEDICGQACCHTRLSQWLDEATRQRSANRS